MTSPKTLGQIAWEVETEGYGWDWGEVHDDDRSHWERIAAAVAAHVRAQCLAEVRSNQLPDATTDFRKGWWSAIDICEHGIQGLK